MEKQAEKYFIGIATRASNQNPQPLIDLWAQFRQDGALAKIPNKKGSSVLAIYTDYESDCTGPYTFLIGSEVTSLETIPDGFVGRVIPPARYETFLAKGHYPQSLISTWQKIWSLPLARAYTYDIEEYDVNFDAHKESEVKVLIAL